MKQLDPNSPMCERWPWTERLGLWMLMLAAAVFVLLTGLISSPAMQSFDEAVVRRLRHQESPDRPIGPLWFVELARDFTALGGYGVLVTLTILVTTFLTLERKPHRARFAATTIVAGYLLSMTLKQLVGRPRPDVVAWLSFPHSSSFPSGHSMMSAIVYLTMGLMLSELASHRRVKVFLAVTPLTISAAVGLSRIYMGVHYLTDVVAGWSAGICWALLCWLVVRRRQSALGCSDSQLN
ncbi:MAG: phosphatase PAP2 family protein [Planctomycetota bacterium]|jgi:undecaprenyl-diphosphatase